MLSEKVAKHFWYKIWVMSNKLPLLPTFCTFSKPIDPLNQLCNVLLLPSRSLVVDSFLTSALSHLHLLLLSYSPPCCLVSIFFTSFSLSLVFESETCQCQSFLTEVNLWDNMSLFLLILPRLSLSLSSSHSSFSFFTSHAGTVSFPLPGTLSPQIPSLPCQPAIPNNIVFTIVVIFKFDSPHAHAYLQKAEVLEVWAPQIILIFRKVIV